MGAQLSKWFGWSVQFLSNLHFVGAPFGNLFVAPLVLDLAEKPTDSNCNSGCASPRLCEEMTLGSTFQIGGSPIDFPAKLAKLDALRLLP